MPPSESSPDRPVLAFRLAAALDLYRTHLDALEKRDADGYSSCLMNLSEGLRSIRMKCAPFASLRAYYVEFLIGHSELVFVVGQGAGGADASRREHRSLLIAAQRVRVENLLRNALEPLSTHAAANDARLGSPQSVEHP